MATNKNATIRYQVLDRCFRNPGRRYYMEDLVDACNEALYEFSGTQDGIKRRQVFEDIKYMESAQGWNIPLEHRKDGRKVYFRYDDMSFSINNQPMNAMEAAQLKEALMSLSRFRGMPQFEWVNELTARLYNLKDNEPGGKHIIDFDQNQYLTGLEYISPIYNAILYQQVIQIQYQSFKQEAIQIFIFHPYYLKQYNNRWFVFGRSEENDYIINLSLDRIKGIEETKRDYIRNDMIDFSEYFEDIVGVTLPNDGEIVHITASIQPALVPYIKTKPIHGSQKIKQQTNGEFELSLDVVPNYELEAVLLGYGEGLVVTGPIAFKNKISSRIKIMADKYTHAE